MVAETPDTIGRRNVMLPDPLHARVSRMATELRAETGRTVSLPEVIERAMDLLEQARRAGR